MKRNKVYLYICGGCH